VQWASGRCRSVTDEPLVHNEGIAIRKCVVSLDTLTNPAFIAYITLTAFGSDTETTLGPRRTMLPYFRCSFICSSSGRRPVTKANLHRLVTEAANGPGIELMPWPYLLWRSQAIKATSKRGAAKRYRGVISINCTNIVILVGGRGWDVNICLRLQEEFQGK
jgi:hypothetical protein